MGTWNIGAPKCKQGTGSVTSIVMFLQAKAVELSPTLFSCDLRANGPPRLSASLFSTLLSCSFAISRKSARFNGLKMMFSSILRTAHQNTSKIIPKTANVGIPPLNHILSHFFHVQASDSGTLGGTHLPWLHALLQSPGRAQLTTHRMPSADAKDNTSMNFFS